MTFQTTRTNFGNIKILEISHDSDTQLIDRAKKDGTLEPSQSFLIKPEQEFENFSSYQITDFIGIQPDSIKSVLYIKNNLIAKIPYTELNSNEEKTALFPFTLICDEKFIEVNDTWTMIKDNLILNKNTSEDVITYINAILSECLSKIGGSAKNPLGRYIKIDVNKLQDVKFSDGSSVALRVKPSFISQILIYFSIITIWMGLVVLWRDFINCIKKAIEEYKNKNTESIQGS